MIAGPVLAGSVQPTARLVAESAFGFAVGASGASGGSSTSVTATVAVTSVLAVPSLARTVSEKLGVVS